MAKLREVFVGADPVNPSPQFANPPGRLGFCQCLSLAFFARSTSFGNEQPSIAEGSHKIRQVVVNFSIVEVANAVGSS